jgi:NADPH:quinone reductase-like Zn-dependent oxidoreductase
MKAVRIFGYGDESVLEYGEAPEPVPGPGEVLIEVRAASVSPADWKIRKGELQKFFPLEFPAILGRDGAGVVMDLGASVDGAAIGDEVCFIVPRGGQGPYAERVVVPAGLLAPKPGNIDFADAAAFPLAGLTAWAALVDTAPVGPGVKVLVHGGAGGVGGMAVQLGRHFGAEVAATCSDANVDYVRDLGASQVVAYDRQNFVALVEGCDVVFDTVGGEVHRRSYEVLKPGGVLVYVIADPIEDLSAEHGVEVRQAVVRDDGAMLRALAELAETGAIVPQVGTVLPLDQVAEAHRLNATGHARGKIVLEVG